MRFAAFLLTAICLAAANGQGFPGAKPDPAGTASLPQGSGGMGALFNVLLALGIVYGLLRYAMPKVMARMNKRLVTGTGSAIRIEESASFAGGSLYVVSARGRSLLISVGAQGVRFLADLTEAPTAPEPASFGEMVERELEATNDKAGLVQGPLSSDKRGTINDKRPWELDGPMAVVDPSVLIGAGSPEKGTESPPATDEEWSAALARLERISK